MTDTGRFGLSYNRISISTVGIVPRMHQLIQDMPDVSLAISLHAPTQVCVCGEFGDDEGKEEDSRCDGSAVLLGGKDPVK